MQWSVPFQVWTGEPTNHPDQLGLTIDKMVKCVSAMKLSVNIATHM